MEHNPYEAPKHPDVAPPTSLERDANGWLPCPSCRSDQVERPGFTWWGGALGPRMLSHVKCLACGTTYNGKTGRSNDTAIAIYVVVTTLLVLALIWVLKF